MDIETKYKPMLIEIIQKKLPNCRIWLFGSRARKSNKPGADIDLALDAGQIIDIHKLFDIKDEIEETSMPLFVDLVDIRNVDSEFLNQIKKEWIEWTQ